MERTTLSGCAKRANTPIGSRDHGPKTFLRHLPGGRRPQDSAADRRRPLSMSASGESRSVFVVQRHFRRVMRGYDPDEVDRHLQLVSQWFVGSRVGEMTREREAELHARERAVALAEEQARQTLEGARVEAQATLEGARLKAGAQADAARRTLAEAQAVAERRRHESEEELAR